MTFCEFSVDIQDADGVWRFDACPNRATRQIESLGGNLEDTRIFVRYACTPCTRHHIPYIRSIVAAVDIGIGQVIEVSRYDQVRGNNGETVRFPYRADLWTTRSIPRSGPGGEEAPAPPARPLPYRSLI